MERDIENALPNEENQPIVRRPDTQAPPQNDVSTWEALKSFLSFIGTPENLRKIVAAQGLNVLQTGSNISSSLFFAKTAIAAFNETKSAEVAGVDVSLEVLATLMAASMALSQMAKAQAQKVLAPVKADTFSRAVNKTVDRQINQKHEVNISQTFYQQMEPIQKSMSGPDLVESVYANIASAFINAMASSIILSIITGLPIIGISTLLTLFTCTLFGATQVKSVVHSKTDYIKKINRVWSDFISFLETKGLINNFGQRAKIMEEMEATNEKLAKALITEEHIKADTSQGYVLITSLISILVGLYGSYQLTGGKLSPNDYLFMWGQFIRNHSIMPEFGAAVTSMLGAATDVVCVEKTWRDDTTQMIDNYPDVKLNLKATQYPAIQFENVSFTYPSTGKKVFEKLSFEIQKGERVAFVGTSGIGKSTLLKLLFRSFQPDSGTIWVNGQDISTVSFESLRENITYVDQRAQLFSGSIGNNIAFGTKSECLEETIWKNAEQLGLDEFLKKLPKKLNTDVGDKGQALSGGQQQKAALVRALMKGVGILLLDEPTASLDSGAALDALIGLRDLDPEAFASILITHKLEEAHLFADRIFVINDCCVTAQGTHQELVENCELYKKLVDKAKAAEEAHSYKKMKALLGNKKSPSTSATSEIRIEIPARVVKQETRISIEEATQVTPRF